MSSRVVSLTLVTLSIVTLSGCGASEPPPAQSPSATPAPQPSDDAAQLGDARTVLERFFAAIDGFYDSGVADASELERVAAPSLAAEWTTSVDERLAAGGRVEGVPVITRIRTDAGTSDGYDVEFCTDRSDMVTFDADQNPIPPVNSNPLVAWRATVVDVSSPSPRLSALQPVPDGETDVCTA